MKFHPDLAANLNTLTSHSETHVTINRIRHDGNLIVTPERIVSGWATGGFDGLDADDFAALAALGARIVLLGTGKRQRFPAPGLLRPLVDAQIGIEIMDLPAACRTFNVLALEGRAVAAALLFD
ncbi:MAG: MTH938/NDUFAF3 family protein [Azoarcus sp.]|nr:MTH938/NDUFAF3 family protein [Azoarcus sp.]